MAKVNGEVPAWITAVDLLNKLKRELVTQAMETLDAEVAAKRIDIQGSLVTQPDQHNETEMKLFVIGRILSNSDQMKERYEGYLKMVGEKGTKATSSEIETSERARLFLMAIERIEMLVSYSSLIDQWINDASMLVREPTVLGILKETCKGEHRKEVFNFVAKSNRIKEEEIITEEERRLIESTLSS